MKRKSTQKNKGMIALISSIILSVILLLLATTLSFKGFYSRLNILDSEIKERSSALADACIDIALLGFAQNPTYSGNVTETVGENSCFVGPVTDLGTTLTFKTRGIFSNSHTNLKIVVDEDDFSIISVEETVTF